MNRRNHKNWRRMVPRSQVNGFSSFPGPCGLAHAGDGVRFPAVGCGQAGQQPFRARCLLLSLVLLICGCSGANDSPLIGTWKSGEDLQLPKVGEQESLRPAELVLTLTATNFDCTMKFDDRTERQTGTYQVLRHVASRWEIRLVADDPGGASDTQPVDLAIRFDDADVINVRQLKGDDRWADWTMSRQQPSRQ